MIDKTQIIELMPHGETMCLIDQVVSWNDSSIMCHTLSHTQKDNPLIEQSLLPVIALIEYGAQAAAIHGALLGNNSLGDTSDNKPAFLGAVKSLEVFTKDVPCIDAPLEIVAVNKMFSASGAIYGFSISLEGEILARARLSLLVPA